MRQRDEIVVDRETHVVLVIPRTLAEQGYWKDMESRELECLCMEQLIEQGLWPGFDHDDYDCANKTWLSKEERQALGLWHDYRPIPDED